MTEVQCDYCEEFGHEIEDCPDLEGCCYNCEWFDKIECKRRAPIVVAYIGSDRKLISSTLWPTVSESNYCGEFKKR